MKQRGHARTACEPQDQVWAGIGRVTVAITELDDGISDLSHLLLLRPTRTRLAFPRRSQSKHTWERDVAASPLTVEARSTLLAFLDQVDEVHRRYAALKRELPALDLGRDRGAADVTRASENVDLTTTLGDLEKDTVRLIEMAMAWQFHVASRREACEPTKPAGTAGGGRP